MTGAISADRLRHPLPHEASRAIEQSSRLAKSARSPKPPKSCMTLPANSRIWELHYNLAVNQMKLGALSDAQQDSSEHVN